MDLAGDPSMSMNSAELLAMFSDGSIDVASLLMSPELAHQHL